MRTATGDRHTPEQVVRNLAQPLSPAARHGRGRYPGQPCRPGDVADQLTAAQIAQLESMFWVYLLVRRWRVEVKPSPERMSFGDTAGPTAARSPLLGVVGIVMSCSPIEITDVVTL